MGKVSTLPRSLKLLREEGWTVEIVEHWNPFAKRRIDLFGAADLIAIREGCRHLLVQVTTASHVADRIAKILSLPAMDLWLKTDGEIEVHGWRAPTKTNRRWSLRRETLLRCRGRLREE
jgi:hypothetical protein